MSGNVRQQRRNGRDSINWNPQPDSSSLIQSPIVLCKKLRCIPCSYLLDPITGLIALRCLSRFLRVAQSFRCPFIRTLTPLGWSCVLRDPWATIVCFTLTFVNRCTWVKVASLASSCLHLLVQSHMVLKLAGIIRSTCLSNFSTPCVPLAAATWPGLTYDTATCAERFLLYKILLIGIFHPLMPLWFIALVIERFEVLQFHHQSSPRRSSSLSSL